MIITPLQIVSINMRRMNFLLPAFLQSTSASIVLVQKIWFGRISTQRSDTDPDGMMIGTVSSHNIQGLKNAESRAMCASL